MVRGITSGVVAVTGAASLAAAVTSDKAPDIDIIDDVTTGMSKRREHIMMKRAGLAGATELPTYRGPIYNPKFFKNKYMPHDGGGKKATAKHSLQMSQDSWVRVTPEVKEAEKRYRKRRHFVG